MNKTLVFKTSYCARYSNAMHAEYHHAVYRLVRDSGVNLSAIYPGCTLLEEWKACIDAELRQAKAVRSAAETAKLEELNNARDVVVGYIFSRIKMAAASPYPHEKAAGKELMPVLGTYNGLQYESATEESGHIRGLLTDLRSTRFLSHVEALNLVSTLSDLEQANEAYAAMYHQRLDTLVAENLGPAHRIRPTTDALLERVKFTLQALWLFSQSEETQGLVALTVDRMNARAVDFRTRYNQSQAQKYGAGSGVPASTDTPINQSGDGTIPSTPIEGDANTPGTDEDTPTPSTGGDTPSDSDTGSDDTGSDQGDDTGTDTGGDTGTDTGGNTGGEGGWDPDDEIIG